MKIWARLSAFGLLCPNMSCINVLKLSPVSIMKKISTENSPRFEFSSEIGSILECADSGLELENVFNNYKVSLRDYYFNNFVKLLTDDMLPTTQYETQKLLTIRECRVSLITSIPPVGITHNWEIEVVTCIIFHHEVIIALQSTIEELTADIDKYIATLEPIEVPRPQK